MTSADDFLCTSAQTPAVDVPRLVYAADEPMLLRLVASPLAARLTKLDCPFDLSESGAAALAASPHLGRLRELRVRSRVVAALAAVVAAPHLTALVSLDLSGSHLNDASASAIAASTALPALTHLDLSWNSIGDEGVGALAASDRLRGLTGLNLRGNPVTETGLIALIASSALAGLTALGLSKTPCGPEDLTAYDQGVAVDSYPDDEAIARLEARFGNRLRIS